MKISLLALLSGFIAGAAALPASAQPFPAQNVEFFERKIRPVLVQHCYRCHSEEAQQNKKLKGRLFLDSRAGLIKGGETGPAIIPGKAKDSLLMKALRYDKLEMPPPGKLPDDVIADFARWIDQGAADPRAGKAVVANHVIDLKEGRKFWSFRPLQQVAPPAVKNHAWVKTPIDRFVLAKQEEKGLVPNTTASKEKLLRRAYYDLIGLPPTPEEIDSFQSDSAADAYERMIDRLLESKHYGERWGRHWLDVVRFAESGGYEFDGDRAGAHYYRDFVIGALNQDMPYDQFIRWQIAGDQLAPNDYHAGSATGFLVAGPYPGQITSKTVERIRYDQLDDMIATVGSSMLGLTLGCVRCHDHKYDPLPQQDYYGLIASLSRTTSTNLKLDPQPEIYRKQKMEFDQAHRPLVEALSRFEKEEFPSRFTKWRQTPLAKGADFKWLVLDPLSANAKATLTRQADGSFLVSGKIDKTDVYTFIAHTHQKKITAIRVDALADKALPGGGPGLHKDGSFILSKIEISAAPLDPKNKTKPTPVKLKAAKATFEQKGRPLSAALGADPKTGWSIGGQAGKDHAAVFEVEGDLGFDGGTALTLVLKFEASGFAIGRPRLALSTAPRPAGLEGMAGLQNTREIHTLLDPVNGGLSDKSQSAMLRWYRRFDDQADGLFKAMEEHAKKEPQPQLASVFAVGQGGGEVYFLVRGEVDRKQGKVAPSFIQVLTNDQAKVGPVSAEPRVTLAQWLTDAERGAGHLLARVMVNRMWKHHFGKGIVGTPNDFGAQGERPSHPELLDWLAAEFIKGGWRLKPLHRLMMTSAAYMQGNEVSPANLQVDPDNRFLWHRAPRRLEGEIIRDALLHVSGGLDAKQFGPGTLDQNNPRRSIYLTVKRSQLIPFLQMFDAPEPIQSIGERSSTTVATQALAMMNSPFVRQRAEKFAQRLAPAKAESLDSVVERAYRAALSRLPTVTERERMVAFLNMQTPSATPQTREQALTEFCQVLLCLNEFIYVD